MKQTILIGAVAAIVVATIFMYGPRADIAPQITPVFSLPTESVGAASTTVQSAPSLSKPTTESSPQEIATARAAFIVGEKTYSANVMPGETVLGAMRALASTSGFAFTGRDYSSLGFFVESINGKRQADGYIWIFYINGAKSSVGASSAALNADDVVEWKYEKSL